MYPGWPITPVQKRSVATLFWFLWSSKSWRETVMTGTLPKSKIIHYPKSVQSDSYFFLWLGKPKPLWAKKIQIVQTWLKPCPLIGTTWTTFDPKEPCQDNSRCYDTSNHHPSTIRVPNLNKRKKQEEKIKIKRIMIFPSCIWDIWINSNERNPHQRNKKSEILEKEKSEVINFPQGIAF